MFIPGDLIVYEQTDTSYVNGYLKSTTSGFDIFASRPTDNKGGFICTGEFNLCNLPNSGTMNSILQNS